MARIILVFDDALTAPTFGTRLLLSSPPFISRPMPIVGFTFDRLLRVWVNELPILGFRRILNRLLCRCS
jgi:hypothetical protein